MRSFFTWFVTLSGLLLMLLAGIAPPVLIIWVAWHFISKFW